MVSAGMNILGGFLGGINDQYAGRQKLQDETDLAYQRELAKVNPEIAIRTAAERVKGDEDRKTLDSKYGNAAPSALAAQLQAITQNPAGNAAVQAVPGQMPTDTPADITDNNAPIVPATPPVEDANTSTVVPTTQGPAQPTQVNQVPGGQHAAMPQPNLQIAQNTPAAISPQEAQVYAAHGITDPAAQGYLQAVGRENIDQKALREAYDMQAKNGKQEPIDYENMGTLDQEDIKARQAAGLIKNAPKHPISSSQQKDVDKLINDAGNQRDSAAKAVNTYNSLLGLSDDVITGPFANAEAKIRATVNQMTDQQASQALVNLQVANKDLIQLTNAQVRGLGGAIRPGIGMLKLEKEGVPNVEMSKQALLEVTNQGLAIAKALINHNDAIMSGQSNVFLASDRQKFAAHMDDLNPPLLGDGATPNPSFLDFSTLRSAVASGDFKPATSGVDIRNANGKVAKEQKPTENTAPKVDWIFKDGKLVPNQ